MSDFAPAYFGRNLIPISYDQWVELFTNPTYKIVEQTAVVSAADPSVGYDISTVWLGMDHGYGEHELPVIFETMVFRMGGAEVEQPKIGEDPEAWDAINAEDLECDRYSLESEAKAGHAAMVVKYTLKVTDAIVMDRTPTQEGSSS